MMVPLQRGLCFAVFLALFCAVAFAAQTEDRSKSIPLTTESEAARRAFLGGLENIQNQQTKRAHVDFRSAARADANFALAHLFLAYDNGDPAEEMAELKKSRELAANASKPEQQLVQWLAGWRMGELVPAISAMNDLLASYPEDKFLLFLAGRWMITQKNYEAAQHLLERAVALDPNYPAALNELGYAYAGTRSFDKAFASLDKYVKLLPGEPNTEDSYGEISRKAGRYEQALEHYRKALSYDSTFIWSQVGLADTYMLMGKEQQARVEYAKAIAMAPSAGDRLTWQIQTALSFLYAGQHAVGDEQMDRVAQEAHAAHIGKQEATCYLILAEYDPDWSGALEHAKEAENALSEKTDISASDREQSMAQVLQVLAVRAATFGQTEVANDALKRLADMAVSSRDTVVQQANEGAIGGVLWAQKKYAEAVPHLQEDELNPLSAARLLQALRATGDNAQAERVAAMVDGYHEATIDDLMARQLLESRPRKK
jgi:tetratricopeptide (TPR) repeat protein